MEAQAPEFAGGGGADVIRRAVLIGTGSPGSENQCVALVRALGIADDNLTVYRVTRPRGGINDCLGVLPVSLHKLIDRFLVRPFSRRAGPRKHVPNGGLAALSPSVPEADAKEIVAAARDAFDKLCLCHSGRYSAEDADLLRDNPDATPKGFALKALTWSWLPVTIDC
ncbi:hypothetical protein HU200_038734 [Digitaria exilis]|uniref:Uncharacterized protein n=1 Tax=Digitaria exilis TaxID=1010633 RepID=A0A835BBR6_9POAL|nr:hypothetical protein HU200_038734 [Digitaria exilis]